MSGPDVEAVLAQCTPAHLKRMAVAYQSMEETGNAIITAAIRKLGSSPK